MFEIRSILLAFALFFGAMQATAQRPYFVYLQSENQEPFVVVLNKKNFSSSGVGHLILSGLTNGSYTIQVGAAGQNPNQEFMLEIRDADQGYLIKKFDGDNNFGLVNLQNSSVQMSGARRKETAEMESQKALAAVEAQKAEEARLKEEARAKEDAAASEKARQAELAALEAEKAKTDKVQNEATANQAEVVKEQQAVKEVEKKETPVGTGTQKVVGETSQTAGTAAVVTGAVVAGTIAAVPQKSSEPETKKAVTSTAEAETVVGNNPTTTAPGTRLSPAEIARLQEEARKIDAQGKRDSVLKMQKNSPATGTKPVFLDIDFTMPADSAKTTEDLKAADPMKWEAQPIDSSKKALTEKAIEETTNNSTAVIPATELVAATLLVVPEKKDSIVIVSPTLPSAPDSALPVKNPNCTSEATNADVELVSMLMKGEKVADDALEIARKSMRIKCLSTAQVRVFALIFENQEDRYRLLDLAYRYTTDRHKYSALSDLLTDTYYLNRFKAMVE